MGSESRPNWLDSEFLTTCLQAKEKGLIEDISFTTEQGVPAGNNFMGCILRVKIKYSVDGETKLVSLILKYSPEGIDRERIHGAIETKEDHFYNLVLSDIRKIYNLNICPERYQSPVQSVLVMEDLKASGYDMKDRRTLLDFEHCKFFIDALAKLHATSAVASKKNSKLIESIGSNMFFILEKTKEEEKNFWKLGVKNAMKCLSSTIENNKDYEEEHKIIEAATDSLWEMMISFYKLPDTFKTITHGDCWTTNMMFKYDASGNVMSVKTFDFQCSSFSPAVMDLVYFIWLSSNNDVREDRLDELYHLYCEILNSTLRQLGSDITLTYSRLKEEIILASPLILYCVAFRLPAHLFDGVFTLDEWRKQVVSDRINMHIQFHQGKSYSKVFPHILRQMKREGVFEYLKKMLYTSVLDCK